MVHLPPLPGRPNHDGTPMGAIADAAVADACTLQDAGFDAVLVQNSLDRPTRARVDAATVAQLARVCANVAAACRLPMGVNVHKNDGPAAVAIAAATGATFVRVKVHTGCVLGPEGLVTGCAEETLALRSRLGADVAVWADVHDTTSRPLAGDVFEVAATDAAEFGQADALVVTRSSVAATLATIAVLRPRLADVPLVIGGRVTAETAAEAARGSDAMIIGSTLKAEPGLDGRVDLRRAEAVVRAAAAP